MVSTGSWTWYSCSETPARLTEHSQARTHRGKQQGSCSFRKCSLLERRGLRGTRVAWMFKAQGMTIQLGTIPAHTDRHNSLDQRKQLQTRLLEMLKSGTRQTMTRAPKSVTVKGDTAQRTCRPSTSSWLQPKEQSSLQPRHLPRQQHQYMHGNPSRLGTKPLDTGFPTRIAPCQGAQQLWLKPSCKHRASWGQSGTWSCSRAPRGARTWRITGCHSAPRITAWTWDYHGVTAAGTFPVSSPWLCSRSRPRRMFLRTLSVVTLMAIPVSSPDIECHRPLRLSTKEKPEGNSTQQELYKGLSAVQALPHEASCSAWPPWTAGFQLQTRLQLHRAAAASLDVLLQCPER